MRAREPGSGPLSCRVDDDPAALLSEYRHLSHHAVELLGELHAIQGQLAAIMQVFSGGHLLPGSHQPPAILSPDASRPAPSDLTDIRSVYRVLPDPEGRAHLDIIEPRPEFRPNAPEGTPSISPGNAPDIADLQLLDTPADIHAAARPIFDTLDPTREHFVLLLCTSRAQLQGYRVIASGTAGQVIVHARDIIRAAMLLGAAAIVAVHNHPTGDLEPSRADIALTEKLIETGRLTHIPLIDHLILSPRGHLSIREHSPLLFDHT